ncbi:hypothetical protein G3N18_09905 [Microbacterium sp. 2C]|uniref:hypothetical protein n=1 Tax=Microbacterium paulum TaxID=2707006 RepID=UPI0018C2FBFF|nr:hypothetical protein [Microbacterium paulum]MBG0718373.1 hypothetical protein [Microbacterium paulum]
MQSLEDLTASIRSEGSRSQFDEAVRAYRAGAYKSATIALWIAVIHDIIEKVRTLAEDDDAQAKTVIAELDAARASRNIPKLQQIENAALEKARDGFELITHREFDELRRLYEDRNACAHPSFLSDIEDPFQLTEEQVRAHARSVVDSLLSQPAKVGRALLDRFFTDIRSNSWPEDDLSEFLRTRYFDRSRSTGTRNLLTAGLKLAIRPGDESNVTAGRCVATLHAAAQTDRGAVDSVIRSVLGRWRDSLTDQDLARCVGAVGSFRATWAALGADNAARATTLFRSDTGWLIENRAFASGPPADEDVSTSYRDAIDRLTFEQVDALTRRPYNSVQWVEPAVKFLADSRSYRSAEERLRVVLRLASVLDLDSLRKVTESLALNTQVAYAGGTKTLLLQLLDETLATPGARRVWVEAMTKYAGNYDRTADVSGEYSYEEVSARLSDDTE